MIHSRLKSLFLLPGFLLAIAPVFAQMEVQDDPYLPKSVQSRATSPAYYFNNGFFETRQVNVDENGNNILNDAANEPSIAVSPVDPLKMAIGWRQFDDVSNNFRQAGFGYTLDGGFTWINPGPIDAGVFRSDPVLDVDKNGQFYYNSLLISGSYSCDVFRSSGNGTWDAGAYAWGGDKQWMAVDKTDGPGSGQIYCNWNRSFSICNGDFTRSTDGGDSFEACTNMDPALQWGNLTVGPDGVVYAAGAGSAIRKSENAQNSNETPVWENISGYMGGDLVGFSSISPNPGGLLGQAWVAVNPAPGPYYNQIYAVATLQQQNSGDPCDVMFIRSSDGGATWTAPYKVNNDTDTNNFQWFGTLSVAPNGRIDIIWLDTRDNLPGTFLSSLYYAHSEDSGENWSDNIRLSEAFDPHLGWPNQNKIGDYFHMVSDNEGAHIAWAGTFNGEQDVYYGHINLITSSVKAPHSAGAELISNYPNPFREGTNIRLNLAKPGAVVVTIFNHQGMQINQLSKQFSDDGEQSVYWDGRNADGRALPSGIYFYDVEAEGQHIGVQRAVRIK